MKTKTIVKILVGVVVIGGGISYFMFQAMQSSWAYYYSVDDLAADSTAAKSHSLRIAGRVKDDSIIRNPEQMKLSFVLAGSSNEMPVEYKGVVPDNFDDGREVVVEGKLDAKGTFQANNLMTKCESKYEAKVK